MAEHGALALTVYYAGMSIGRFVSGLLVGIKVYPVLLAVLYVIMFVGLKHFTNQLKKQGKYNPNI